jgi:hypothetical protein
MRFLACCVAVATTRPLLAACLLSAGWAACKTTNGIILGSGGHEVGLKTLSDCCAACQANSDCAAFTWDGAAGSPSTKNACWLKTNAASQGKCNSGKPCVSGLSGTVSGPNTACRGDFGHFPFCDTSLPLEARLDDLVARVNVSEMASQLTARESGALDRLGIPAYYWGTNALHSFREAHCVKDPATGKTVCPTAFPTPPNFGASFNMSLARDMGHSFGVELRAFYNMRELHSLDTWSPTINIARDPRCIVTCNSAAEATWPLVCD